MIYVYNSTRSDWLWAPYFLNYFKSELFYRDGPFTKNVSFVGARKNVIFSKLVNNPFKACDSNTWVEIHVFVEKTFLFMSPLCSSLLNCAVYISISCTGSKEKTSPRNLKGEATIKHSNQSVRWKTIFIGSFRKLSWSF